VPAGGEKVLEEFNVWNVVQSKRLLYQSLISFVILMVLFILIPSSLISPDIIALSIAIILIILTRLNPKDIISKIDLELILYLLGIFIIAGGLEITGVTDAIGIALLNIGGVNLYLQLLILLWFSAYLSSCIDNIPITKVLIPVADAMAGSVPLINRNKIFYSLTIGANWGDNLTPLGDNILVLNIAEQHKRPITFKSFFKLGFVVTNYQLILVSLYYTFVFNIILGLIILGTVIVIIVSVIILHRFGPNKVNSMINKILTKIRDIIIR
jgi:Na+/H+ antiporter NhaD/arsenite permease-like protein